MKVFFAASVLIGSLIFIHVTSGSTLASWVWNKTRCGACATFIDSKNPHLQFEIGNYFFGEGAYDTSVAETHYRSTLTLDDRYAGAHYQLARIYFIRGELGKALVEINKELELNPEFYRSYYVRGLINGYGGLLPEAAADFSRFLEWKPESWAGYNDLAWVYFQMGAFSKVEEAARKGLEFQPYNPWLLNSLGVALLNLEKNEEAREVLELSLEILKSKTPEDWGRAYPGNDPNVYADGFEQMKKSIQDNLRLLEGVDS